MSEDVTEPYVGMPATIRLFTDSLPAVVIRVNRKSVTVRTVEFDESSRVQINEGEPLPCYYWQGITDQPVGDPQRFPMVKPGVYRNGSIGLSLGRSLRVIDYRY